MVALGALLLLPLGLSDGGYFGRSLAALTLALGATAAIALLHSGVVLPSAAFVATAIGLVLLAVWVGLSALWAVDGAGVELEARRCILYAVALVAVGLVVGGRSRIFLVALTGAVSTLAVVGLSMRTVSGIPVDPYYGSLLAEPIGYPNAMGVLVAIGAVLALGLQAPGERGARVLQGVASLLVLVLGLSGSRGGALALVAGMCVLVALTARPDRLPCVGKAASALAVGGGAWGVTMAAGGAGGSLVLAAAAAAAIGAAVPTFGRRGALVLLSGLALAACAVVALDPPSTTSSFRSAYWSAAFDEARERPLLGSGAGSYYLSWRSTERSTRASATPTASTWRRSRSSVPSAWCSCSWSSRCRSAQRFAEGEIRSWRPQPRASPCSRSMRGSIGTGRCPW
jgi:hypothetical protein